MSEDASARIARMMRQNGQALDLARFLSLAVLIDPALMRATRLALMPRADVGAEVDLWFGPLVQTRNREGIVLLPAVAEMLRGRLDARLAARAWAITKQLHDYLPPAVRLEEELNYLSLEPDETKRTKAIDAKLRTALVALLRDKRAEVANWAGRALPRLSQKVRESEGGQMLSAASDLRLGRGMSGAQYLRGDAIPGWFAAVLPENFQTAPLAVRVSGRVLILDPTAQAVGEPIKLPVTEPRVVQVSQGGRKPQIIFIASDAAQTVPLADDGPIELVTLAGEAFTVERISRPDASPAQALSARAYANCNQALIVWHMAEPPPGLIGFALERINERGESQIVQNRALLPAQTSDEHPTTIVPLQRFMWIDQRRGSYVYRIVPVLGAHRELATELEVRTNQVNIDLDLTGTIAPVFNRPPYAAQAAAGTLKADQARQLLGGEVRRTLLGLLNTARVEGGHIFAALFMLDDAELIEALASLGPRAHVILSYDPLEARRAEQFRKAQAALASAGAEINVRKARRFMHTGFMVICEQDQRPRRVWTGSLNWTTAALFAQDSNALVINESALAARYREQWLRLRDGGTGARLETSNAQAWRGSTMDGARMTLWFAPARGSPELEHVRACIDAATSGILFSIGPQANATTLVGDIMRHRGRVYIAGVGRRTNLNDIAVYQHSKEVIAKRERVPQDAFGIVGLRPNATTLPVGSRLIVIDPFDEHPVVITGSHTLTPAASRMNDEDLLIIEGNRPLAQACAVHIKGLIDHFTFRAQMQRQKKTVALTVRYDDSWLKGYLSDERQRELAFWLGTLRAAQLSAQDVEAAARAQTRSKPPRKKAAKKVAKTKKMTRVAKKTVAKTSAKKTARRLKLKRKK